MEEYSQKIVDNIKHEPEAHFVCYLPSDPKTDDEPKVKEVNSFVRKFDKKWKMPAKLFESYFACGKCEFVNKMQGELNRHLKTCKPLKKCEECRLFSKSENIIKCCFCDLKFKCNNCKSIHIFLVHQKDSRWLCSICDYNTSIKNYLKTHYQTHLKKFSCETCEQNFSFGNLLKKHQQQHRHGVYATIEDIKFECSLCIHSFTTKHGLSQHQINVHNERKFHCDVCGKIKNTKKQLQIHVQTHFKIPCPICHHLFAEIRLQSHIERHTITPRFKCDACDKICFNQHSLNNHKLWKHEIQQVQCDLCNKFFKNKLRLRSHITSHLKVSCPICSKSIGKHSFYIHMRIHSSKQESLACDILYCHQKFSSLKELEEHKKVHIGPQNYKCLNCKYQTKRFQQMQRHVRRHRT